jgi:hypothetical protein
MKEGEKIEKLREGMENLSEGGRAYIKNMAEALLGYQNSPGLSSTAEAEAAVTPAAGQRGRVKPDAARFGNINEGDRW